MAALRTIALMAFISHINVSRPFARLMATAFAPPRNAFTTRVGSVTCRASSSFSQPNGISASSSCVAHMQPSRTPFSFAKLYSTTPDDSGDAVAIVSSHDDAILEIDPYSEQAKEELANFYEQNGIETDDIDNIHDSLLRLTEAVLSWNRKLNLISRKDCTAAVVYHRHILPSVALLPLVLEAQQSESESPLNVIDVGTGGGFPGLPLALLLPDAQFTLVDSVQKKLKAVGDMAAELEMANVRIHWGRVEEMYDGDKGRREHKGRYDVVLGRSVTALPRFCGWVSDLMKGNGSIGKDDAGEEGRLVYIIGGELDDLVESRIVHDIPVDTLLQRAEGTSDKRALIFNAKDVEVIGRESGEKNRIVRSAPPKKKNINKNAQNKGGKKMAKGAWSKKQNDVKKDRGYDSFQRFES